MDSIQAKLKIINDAINTQDEEHIINTLKTIHPIILMYYKITNNTFDYYNKLPKEYFSIYNMNMDDVIDILMDINDIDFIIYIIKEFKLILYTYKSSIKRKELIDGIVSDYIDNNETDKLDIFNQKCTEIGFNILHSIYDYCYRFQ